MFYFIVLSKIEINLDRVGLLRFLHILETKCRNGYVLRQRKNALAIIPLKEI